MVALTRPDGTPPGLSIPEQERLAGLLAVARADLPHCSAASASGPAIQVLAAARLFLKDTDRLWRTVRCAEMAGLDGRQVIRAASGPCHPMMHLRPTPRRAPTPNRRAQASSCTPWQRSSASQLQSARPASAEDVDQRPGLRQVGDQALQFAGRLADTCDRAHLAFLTRGGAVSEPEHGTAQDDTRCWRSRIA